MLINKLVLIGIYLAGYFTISDSRRDTPSEWSARLIHAFRNLPPKDSPQLLAAEESRIICDALGNCSRRCKWKKGGMLCDGLFWDVSIMRFVQESKRLIIK